MCERHKLHKHLDLIVRLSNYSLKEVDKLGHIRLKFLIELFKVNIDSIKVF